MTRQTSIETYRKIEADGLLSHRRWQVYQALWHSGPCTGSELLKVLQQRFKFSGPTNANITTRLGELRDMEVVSELGTKECGVTGQTVILWDVTKKLPIQKPKSTKIKCPTCNGKGHIKQGRLL